jgi:pyridoxal phosphate enzyme (YggS family)
MSGSLRERIKRVQEIIALACEKAQRDPREITVVAVTKGVGVDSMREALECGIRIFGENRLQEALSKIPLFGKEEAEWHFIGRVQGNKIKKIVENFQCVHSLDRVDHGREMEKRLKERGVAGYPVFVQVNLTGRETQGGVKEERLLDLVQELGVMSSLRVTGLMTIAPLGGKEEEIRGVFRRLRELKERINAENIPGVCITELSMGMSDDYPLAILEGATMVRLGRAIFGEGRKK